MYEIKPKSVIRIWTVFCFSLEQVSLLEEGA